MGSIAFCDVPNWLNISPTGPGINEPTPALINVSVGDIRLSISVILPKAVSSPTEPLIFPSLSIGLLYLSKSLLFWSATSTIPV